MLPDHPEQLVFVVRPGKRTRTVLGWLRQFFPAALLLVAAGTFPPLEPDAEVITLDADAVDSSPLALADAVAKSRHPG